MLSSNETELITRSTGTQGTAKEQQIGEFVQHNGLGRSSAHEPKLGQHLEDQKIFLEYYKEQEPAKFEATYEMLTMAFSD